MMELGSLAIPLPLKAVSSCTNLKIGRSKRDYKQRGFEGSNPSSNTQLRRS